MSSPPSSPNAEDTTASPPSSPAAVSPGSTVRFKTDGTVYLDDTMAVEEVNSRPTTNQSYKMKPRLTKRLRPRGTPTAVECRLVRKYEPVPSPMGQGPFKRQWLPFTRSEMTPGEMFLAAKDILDPQIGAQQKKKIPFGQGFSKHGMRKIGAPAFGGYSERSSSGASYGGWMGNPGTPGPGEYKISSRYGQPLINKAPSDPACQPFCSARWQRAARGSNNASGRDPDIAWEFEYVKVDCVRPDIRASSISGAVAPSRESSCAPGAATYLPSMRAVTADHRVVSFSKDPRNPLGITPWERNCVNAGPKYALWRQWGTGYPHAQCTFPRAPTGRLPDIPAYE